MEGFIKLLREEIREFASDNEGHKLNTGAIVFDNESAMMYAEGLVRALEIAESIQSDESKKCT